jgi:hypothetical protein
MRERVKRERPSGRTVLMTPLKLQIFDLTNVCIVV